MQFIILSIFFIPILYTFINKTFMSYWYFMIGIEIVKNVVYKIFTQYMKSEKQFYYSTIATKGNTINMRRYNNNKN